MLGHGKLSELRDLVVVDNDRFDRMRSVEIADQVARFNAPLFVRHIRLPEPLEVVMNGRIGEGVILKKRS